MGEVLGTETCGEVMAVGMEGPGWCSLRVLPESRIEGRGRDPEGRRPCCLCGSHTLLTRHVVFYSASYSPPPPLLSDGALLPRLRPDGGLRAGGEGICLHPRCGHGASAFGPTRTFTLFKDSQLTRRARWELEQAGEQEGTLGNQLGRLPGGTWTRESKEFIN